MPPRASAERYRPASHRTRRGNHTVLVVLARDSALVRKARVVRATAVPAVGLAATAVVPSARATVVVRVVRARVGCPGAAALVAAPTAVDPVAKPAAPIEAGIPTQAHFPQDVARAVAEHSVPLQTSCSSPSGRVPWRRANSRPGSGSRSRPSGQTRPAPKPIVSAGSLIAPPPKAEIANSGGSPGDQRSGRRQLRCPRHAEPAPNRTKPIQ